VIKGVLGLAAILTFAVITNLLYEALFNRSVVIEPISVPKDLEEKGYTPDVAALHLLDAMNKYVVHAHTSGAGPKLALHKDQADFVLPNVGLSFKAVVAQIRTFIPIAGSENISGEIMRVGEKLRLRLRKNGVVIYESESPDAVDAKDLKKDLKEALKALFNDAALGVFAATDPYFEAVANSDKNPEAAFDLAKRIIADWPPDQNVVWAHNLVGLLLSQKGKLDGDTGAVNEFKRMIDHHGFWDHDPRLAIAHLNRGLAYIEQGRRDEAINDFRSAIRIRPELGTAHQSLGDVLDQMGAAEEARCEYLEAIARFRQAVVANPSSAAAHQRLGIALNNKEKADKCASNNTHNENVLKDVGPYDSVIAEYQRAAELDPDDAHIHYDLGVKLLPDQVDKSIDELREALESREGSNDSFDEFRYNLLKTLSQALYIKARRGKDKEIGDNVKATLEDLEAEGLFYQAVEANEALIDRIKRKALIDKESNDNAAAYRRRGADLYLIGKFGEAVAAHRIALAIDKTYFADKMDRGYARFALGNERAAEDFNRAADDFDDAADDFNHAVKFSSAPPDTMIWLYLSREHSRIVLRNKYYRQKDHKDELKSNASKLLASNREDWRIKLFVNNKLPDGVLKREDVVKNVKGTDNQCKTYFYIGEWHALDERRNEARDFLEQAKKVCQFYDIERSAAEAELKRLRPGQAVATMGISPGVSTDPHRSGP
jgi:tetratricopeptide (TPR) repeat protein